MGDGPAKRATSFDVAKLAGVSRSAVSRAFSKDAVISDETRKKVIKAADELGYSVNLMARSLQNKHTNLVGIVVSALDSPFRARQVKVTAQEFLRQGFRPILLTAETADEVEKLSEVLFNYNVAGILITSATPPSRIIAECNRLSIPIVLVNRGGEVDGTDNIHMDIDQGGALALEMLSKSGATTMGVVMPQTPSFSVTGRAEVFAANCRKADIAVQEFYAPGQSYSAGDAVVEQLYQAITNTGLNGVFCSTDTLAFGVLDGLRHTYGIDVPGDVQILGFDDVEQAAWGAYQLSTIRQDSDIQAVAAVEMMLTRIQKPGPPAQTIVQPVTPVYRNTTRHTE